MHDPDIVFVDNTDKVVSHGSRTECITAGFTARISRVFILDSSGSVLLQQRQTGAWDQSAGGHVDYGESYHQAAIRELHEEMGITKKRLKLIGSFYSSDATPYGKRHRFNRLYIGRYDGPVCIEPVEVMDYCWIRIKELDELISSGAVTFTRGMLTSYELLRAYLEK